MRPVIGLTHSIQSDEKRLMMPMSYSNVVREAGGTPILLPITRDVEVIAAYAELVDGVLFSGGEDVDPSYYGEEQLWACGDVLPLRDEFELKLCRLLLEKHPEKPILGICRGE
ncbi:MAG: gamma-glutamyl-gamma-aminobutyrate hydrolase family protein, partial [Clostridia bacterium]|nr:gamma-glutamyl-gamma-aminobutyrate hydrolase family protein [Clostridia bacterium]